MTQDFVLEVYESPFLSELDREYLITILESTPLLPDHHSNMYDGVDRGMDRAQRMIDARNKGANEMNAINAKYDRRVHNLGTVQKAALAGTAASAAAMTGSTLACKRSLKELEKINTQIKNKQEEIRKNKNPMRIKALKVELQDLIKVQEIEKKKYNTLTKVAGATSAAVLASMGTYGAASGIKDHNDTTKRYRDLHIAKGSAAANIKAIANGTI